MPQQGRCRCALGVWRAGMPNGGTTKVGCNIIVFFSFRSPLKLAAGGNAAAHLHDDSEGILRVVAGQRQKANKSMLYHMYATEQPAVLTKGILAGKPWAPLLWTHCSTLQRRKRPVETPWSAFTICATEQCWRHKAACTEFEHWPNLLRSPPSSYQPSPSLTDFSCVHCPTLTT